MGIMSRSRDVSSETQSLEIVPCHLAPSSKVLAILVEHKGDRDEGNAKESEETIAPVDAESLE